MTPNRLAFLLLALLALPALGDDHPDAVVRAFYDAYASGDLTAAVSQWDAAAAPAFLRKAERQLRVRCLTHHEIALDAAVVNGSTATIDAEAHVTVWSNAPGSRPRTEVRYTTFRLTRTDQWRITSWTPRESDLAQRLKRASPADRMAAIWSNERMRTPAMAVALTEISLSLSLENAHAEANAILDHARTIAVETGDDAAMATVDSVEGALIGRRDGDRERALAIGRRSVEIARRSGDPDALAKAIYRFGRAVGAGRKAPHELFEEVLALEELVDDVSILGFTAAQLSITSTDDPPRQLRYALLSLRYAEVGGAPASLYNAHYALSGVYANLGYFGPAIEHARIAEDIATRNGVKQSMAAALFVLARAYLSLGRREEAMDAFERGLAVATPDLEAHLRIWRADDAIGSLRLADAEADLVRARALPASDQARVAALFALTQLRLMQGRREEALEIANEAVRLALTLRETRHRIDAAYGAALVLRRMKRYDEAREQLATMRREMEADPAAGYDETRWTSVYERRAIWEAEEVGLAVERGDIRAAARLASNTKGRALRAIIERRAELPSQRLGAENLAREKTLDEQLARLNRQLLPGGLPPSRRAEIEKEIERVRVQVDALRGREVASRAEPLPTPAPVADALDLAPRHAVVHYLQTFDELLIIGMAPGKGSTRRVIAASRRITPAEMTAKVDALLLLLQRRDLRYARAASEMFDFVLGPVQSLLAPEATLCVIPDGALWRVPFHALRAPDGRYVVESAQLFYAPAQSLADRGETKAPRSRSLVAFGNPELHARSVAQYRTAFSGVDVGRLPDAEAEVREVARLYGPGSRLYVGDAATERTLKNTAGRVDILHLATHGAAVPTSPLTSAVLLVPGAPTEDGVLEAREIMRLDLQPGLAVLSTCESGAGETRRGEGIIGLSWAFLATGCQTTVVSQWSATSHITSRLMIAFHRHLRRGHSEAAALQKAQNEIRRDERYRHPYYWAPFVVVGGQ